MWLVRLGSLMRCTLNTHRATSCLFLQALRSFSLVLLYSGQVVLDVEETNINKLILYTHISLSSSLFVFASHYEVCRERERELMASFVFCELLIFCKSCTTNQMNMYKGVFTFFVHFLLILCSQVRKHRLELVLIVHMCVCVCVCWRCLVFSPCLHLMLLS